MTLNRRHFLGETALIATASLLVRTAQASPNDCVGSPAITKSRLTNAEWRALLLTVRVMLPRPLPPNGPSDTDVVANLERFVGNADAETLAELRQGLRAVGALAPSLNDDLEGVALAIDRTLRQREASIIKTLLDSLHKVAVLGYYSHHKADDLVGYKRPRVVPKAKTCLPTRERPSPRIFDIAIVGAGVAGSLLAERLTRAGKSVVILEAGPYVAEKDLDADELIWIARLQKGSGLQRANANTHFASSVCEFPILQAACVGGGGMINNAVCFQMPDARIDAWSGVGFPVAKTTMRDAYQAVARELRIVTVSKAMESTGFLNRSLDYADLGPRHGPSSIDTPMTPGLWECLVNLEQCTGCGLCNTGCGFERKRNALQVHLPAALSRGDLCELVPNAKVERIALRRRVFGAPLRVDSLQVRTTKGEQFTVRAREFVLSAGAVHTSALLLQSPDVMEVVGSLPIGKRFFVNLASPVLGFFDTPVIHEHPALQLTHFYLPENPKHAFLIEDLYNPPGQAALVMPGFGKTHAERMLRYRYTSLAGAVVPTTSHGAITLHETTRRPLIEVPLADEMERFRLALTTLAKAMLKGRDGKKPHTVIAGVTGGGFEMKSEEAVERFGQWLHRFDQIALSTGHPQGGSAMSEDAKIGVVDKRFRVRGFANLRICDASLFPLVAGVNPQWTVMALAHHCADVMNDATHP